MRRYKPGDGMDSQKHYNSDIKPVPEVRKKSK